MLINSKEGKRAHQTNVFKNTFIGGGGIFKGLLCPTSNEYAGWLQCTDCTECQVRTLS